MHDSSPTRSSIDSSIPVSTPATAGARWWGEFDFPVGQARRWRIGPMTFWAQRSEKEWRLGHHSSNETLAEGLEIAADSSFPPMPDDETPDDETVPDEAAPDEMPGEDEPLDEPTPSHILRASGERIDRIQLLPSMADRSVVARPEHPFCILAGSEGTFFVSTLLWLSVRLGAKTGKPDRTQPRPGEGQAVLDIPTSRPADTWFGPSTRSGSLAYALQTKLRRNVDNLPRLPHRAITQVVLRNGTQEMLQVERFNVPVPELALHQDRDGFLWTPVVELDRRSSGEIEIRMDRGLPEVAGDLELVSEARQRASRNLLVRAMSSLLG